MKPWLKTAPLDELACSDDAEREEKWGASVVVARARNHAYIWPVLIDAELNRKVTGLGSCLSLTTKFS